MCNLKAKLYVVNYRFVHQLSPRCRTAARNLESDTHLTWLQVEVAYIIAPPCVKDYEENHWTIYLSYLSCPKLYCPVKRRGDKKMWEVYRSNCCMAVDTCDWSLVSFKHLTDSSFAVLEYITKVNWSGNHTSADRDSTEMQFKYSHKKISAALYGHYPAAKGFVTTDHRRPSLNTDHIFNMYFLLTLSATIHTTGRRD